MNEWARALAGAAADLCNVDSATLARPDFARFYLSQVMASHQVGFSAFAATPTVARLVNLSRGHALVLELLAASLRANASEVPFSRRAFASAYGVSRTHVIDLLNECEATGIITPASAQTLTLSPTFLTEARPRRNIGITQNTPDLGRRRFSDLASAARSQGGVWELCSEPNYGGTCVTTDTDLVLGAAGVDNTIASVRLIRP